MALLNSPYAYPKPRTNASARRGLPRLLDWLEAQPGRTWQERWAASGVEDPAQRIWHDLPANHFAATHAQQIGSTIRNDLGHALQLVIAAGIIRPGYGWILTQLNTMLVSLLARGRDPEGLARLDAAVRDERNGHALKRNPLNRIALIMVAKGGRVEDITVGDCVELWEFRIHERFGSAARSGFYDLLGQAGFLPENAPAFLRMFRPVGQLGPEGLIDRYDIQCRPVRDLLVDYLKERQPTVDYATLTNVAFALGRMFWRDLEDHHPGIDSLHLTTAMTSGWKQRKMFKTRMVTGADGRQREERSPMHGFKEKLHIIRAFYLDIAHWAVEDARWAAWVAPCPISPRDVDQVKDKKQRKARMDQRTRERLPAMPLLLRSVEQRRTSAADALRLALDTPGGELLCIQGQQWRRRVVEGGADGRVWIEPADGGKRRDLAFEENEAFWEWAIVEVLRHTGIRCEELLELSHHSLVQYRLPNTGELVPLLQIVPSKTDAERLLLISPELASVLSLVISRVRDGGGQVPLVVSYDLHERVWNPPMPLLFQRRVGSDRRAFTGNYVRDLLHNAAAVAGLRDSAGDLLELAPHDFRRMFVTEALMNGLPPHIAQAICGHADINTTMGYRAVYPEESILSFRSYLARRRQSRPSEEYRAITDEEWDAFLAHFEKRKVSLGNCGRAFGTSCVHEHACVRCPILQPDPDQRTRLLEIRDNLIARIAEAEREGWLGEVEGLQVSLAGAEDKLEQMDRAATRTPIALGLPIVSATLPGIADW